jgi:hypothetical protein
MSLRNRARSLQKKTGLTYQQALDRLRALGERSARLRRETGWSLDVCDRYLVDGHAPIAVVEQDGRRPTAERGARSRGSAVMDEIQVVCETLRTLTAARSVLLVDLRRRVIAHADSEMAPVEPLTLLRAAAGMCLLASWPPALAQALPSWPTVPTDGVWELDGGRVMVSAAVKKRAVLLVQFQRDETSLGLVRLRMAYAVEELERLLANEETPGMPPLGGGDGPGGLPHELRVVEPVPAERPKRPPTPIGRKRKRER